MVQTGERKEIGILDGRIGSATIPVYVPQMRSLTTQELAELKQQRDQSLDKLKSVAVNEVSE